MKTYCWFLYFVSIYFRPSLSFKIEVFKCTTVYGAQGLCRPLEECVGFRQDELFPSKCRNRGSVCCPRRRVTKLKCDEYGKIIFQSGVDECGISATPLIIGGEKASRKEFPHMAAIGFGQSPDTATWECGGSLISEFFVLTAAHCLWNRGIRPRFVKLGALNVLTDRHRYVQIREIEKYLHHPYYTPAEKYSDIGLLKLKQKVEFNAIVRPACLDYNGLIRENTALATGWGITRYGDEQGSPHLLKVQLNIVEEEHCGRSFNKFLLSRGLQKSQLCAGVLSGGKDTCQGDSGGPLQTVRHEPYCMYKIIGVTSFGLQCGSEWAPAIYSRVFTYLPWIEHVVWPFER